MTAPAKNMLRLSESECSVCGTPNTTQVDILGCKRLVPIMCNCQREKLEKSDREDTYYQKQLKIDRYKAYTIMGSKFKNSTFENWETTADNQQYYQTGLKYCDGWKVNYLKGIGLLLFGQPGNGKTYLASCIANYLTDLKVSVIAISMIGILNKLKDSFKEEDSLQLLKVLSEVELLVIDDLGAESITQWAKQKIYEVIDARVRTGKPIIITTNLQPEQLREFLMQDDEVPRIYDRIIEMCIPYKINGQNLRREIAKSKCDDLKHMIGGTPNAK